MTVDRRAAWIYVFLILYFCVFFWLISSAVEDNKWNPYQGVAHDRNNILITH